jgi:PAS domain S-box-containing protein
MTIARDTGAMEAAVTDRPSERGWPAPRSAIGPLLTAVGYYVSGVLAISFRFEPGGISAIWLPYGVLLAALVLTPPRRWWIHAALVLPTHLHLVSTFQGPVPLSIMLVQYGGMIAQTALAAGLLRPVIGPPPRLDNLPAMTAFLVVGTLLLPLAISAPVAWLFTTTGWVNDFWIAWQRRAFAGMTGAVIVAPAIIDLATGGLAGARRAPRRRRAEYLLVTVVLALLLLALLDWRETRPALMWLPFAPAALLLWSAARFGPGGLGPHLLASALVALFQAKAGLGPFGGPAGLATVLALQGTLLVIAIPLMLLSALVQQHARAARALRDSEARYRSVVEDQTELICRHKQDGTFTFVNGAYCRYFQVRAEDLIGKNFWQFLPPEQHAASRAFLGSITRENPVASIEHAVVAPGGEVRWQQWTDRGFFDEQGRIIEYQSVGHDITERKRAEQAARDSEEQIRLFIQQTPAAVALFDRDMRYLSYSQRWLSDYRLGNQDLVGRSHYDVFPEISEAWKDIHRRCLAGAVDICEESPFTRRDGSLDWIRWDVRPWHNLQHEIGGIVMLTEVITDRKRAQEEHRELLAQTQVAQALREVDRRKDVFLAMLAHELRNPLAPICTAVEVLRRDAPADRTVAWAGDVIARQSAQLTRLVDDLLDVSRITHGKVKLDLAPLDLGPIITQAVETCRPLLTARRHQLSIDLSGQPLPLLGDGVRLNQVISNLLNNAAKYTPEGGHIHLSAQRTGRLVVLRIADNGLGIPAHMLEKVFEMFTQIDDPGSRAQSGLGIGLALVRRLLAMHQGTIEAHSAGPGHGSEFVVRLPLAEPAADADRREGQAPATGAPGRPTPQPSRRKRILVVDDNVDAAESVSRLLRIRQHEVMVVHDGVAALAAANQMNPDVVLLDLGLPKLDGITVARRLRQRTDGPRPLLVATTGFGQAEDKARTAAAGFDHHLTKPIDPQLLHDLVQAIA